MDAEMGKQLRCLGALVSSGKLNVTALPTPPPMPQATNLDVTALCALCSEVSNSSPDCPRITVWAEQKTYFEVRWEAEQHKYQITVW